MNFKYDVTVIIPVYNVEEYLNKCLDEITMQSIDKSKLEVIMIDDGSKDSSPAICDEYAAKYDYMKVIHIENGGVSNARNIGIENAQGKYIMFLDSDDWLTRKSIKNIVKFFDKHYDEIDLVAYEELHCKNGVIKPIKHFRYNIINKSGVYDLSDDPNNYPGNADNDSDNSVNNYIYFLQTHMNICVKNKGNDNVKFDTTMTFHEDQKYILSILADKQKIGYCHNAKYIYLQNSTGTSSLKCHSYYIFDKTTEMWEEFMSGDNIPKYVQAYFFNDFRWKLHSNIIWPYQYKGEEFERQKNRLIEMLKKVDDDIIDNFPWLILAHKIYFYELKYGKTLQIETDDDEYRICRNDETKFKFENIEIYISRFKVKDGQLTFIGVIKCYALNFSDDITLEADFIGNETEHVKLDLEYSSLSMVASKTITNNFKKFVIRRPINDLKKIVFTAKLKGHPYPIHFTYPGTCPFCRPLKRESYICEDTYIKCHGSQISFKKANVLHNTKIAAKNLSKMHKVGVRNTLTKFYAPKYKKEHKIWLYCDSSKTVKDNAYYQFIHDVKKDDGIERYYVYNSEADIDGWFEDSMKDNLIEYGSLKHRLYGLSADKILTSFYGLRDILSYPYGAMRYFADLTNFDVIYLQHGVLHANLPTMYSLDRMMLDREVISTEFEEHSLINNYCFDEPALIKCGMPRYNHIDTTQKAEKKILFAPSWRKFLVQADGKGSWLPNENAFLKSDFYQKTVAFLKDKRLVAALKKHGYVLDFKMHPNFRIYDEFYDLDGEVVRIAEKTVDEFSYSIFMTDFSSFVFDFVYLQRPILYFVPDMDLFEAGLNHYRKLDIPFEEGFGELSTDKDKAVDDVIALLENNCVPEQKYVDRMNGMFFPVEDHCEALYQELMK